MRVTRSSEDTGFKPTQLFGFIGWKGMATLLCDGLREPRHDRPAMPFPIIRILSLNILDTENTEDRFLEVFTSWYRQRAL